MRDFLLVIAGGLVSVLTIIVERLIDRKGETRIYYKIITLPEMTGKPKGWGCISNGNELSFCVPMNIELYNTSNSTRIVRDFSLLAYDDERLVCKMSQVEQIKGKNIIEYGSENNAYSFTIEPRTLQHQSCLFAYTIKLSQKKAISFNKVKVRYYDEKDKTHVATIIDNLDNCWQSNLYELDEDWQRLI